MYRIMEYDSARNLPTYGVWLHVYSYENKHFFLICKYLYYRRRQVIKKGEILNIEALILQIK